MTSASPMRIFLAAPFTDRIDPSNEAIGPEFRAWLTRIIDVLKDDGHTVINAHQREAWGRRLDPPDTALERDLEAIEAADVLVAYLGDPYSPGVQLEIGFALALQKRIIIIAEQDGQLPYLLRGSAEWHGLEVVRFTSSEVLASELRAQLTKPRP